MSEQQRRASPRTIETADGIEPTEDVVIPATAGQRIGRSADHYHPENGDTLDSECACPVEDGTRVPAWVAVSRGLSACSGFDARGGDDA